MLKSLFVLLIIYLAVFSSEWIAPYDYHEQNRRLGYAPPTRLHFFDPEGQWHWRPFVYRLIEHPENPGEYLEDHAKAFPVSFFVTGTTPRQLGPFQIHGRLFGVDEDARILLLGTDRFGRDLFSRLLYGGRISLAAGLLAGMATIGLGLVLGGLAGYYEGLIDDLLMRTGELFTAFPPLFLLVTVRAALPLELEAGSACLVTMLVISLLSWVPPARTVRGVVLSTKQRAHVHAARGFGASDAYLLWTHVLPATWGVLLTHLTLAVPRLVLAEVTLSFLGLGMAEPVPSWGLMLGDLRRSEVLVSYWWMSAPAIALIGVIIGYHQLASVLRQRLSVTAAL